MFRIIVRRNYISSGVEYNPGDYLLDDAGRPLGFSTGSEAMEYAVEHEGEHVVSDGVLEWWKDVD